MWVEEVRTTGRFIYSQSRSRLVEEVIINNSKFEPDDGLEYDMKQISESAFKNMERK